MASAAERLYRGALGAAYWTQHGATEDRRRRDFWLIVRAETRPASVLEVGAGTGHNLTYFPFAMTPTRIAVDVDARPLGSAATRERLCARASALPLRDGVVDLALTAGCLMHVAEADLAAALRDLGRVSRRHVLLVEYEDTHRREIPWRGHRHVLFADRFALRFWMANPGYVPVWRHALTKDDGFAGCTACLFERRDARREG